LNKPTHFFGQHFSIKIPYWILLLLPMAAYIGWEYYWFKTINYRFIKWHTHLLPYLFVWIIGVIALSYIGRTEKRENYTLALSATIAALIACELALLSIGISKTYMEEISGYYYSDYEPQGKSHYNLWDTAMTEHWVQKPEYKYWRPTNTLGFSDINWIKEKKPNTKRILALGDSFTEGDGAPFDSTYVNLLKQKIAATGEIAVTMNAGVCGSDPFFNYMTYTNLLSPYKPDKVLLMIGANDIIRDYRIRGGMERFKTDGTTQYRKPPWWEPLYACSHIFRCYMKILGYNQTLLPDTFSEPEKKLTDFEISTVLKNLNEVCVHDSAKLFLIIQPVLGELIYNKYSYDFTAIKDSLKHQENIQILDLLPAFQSKMITSKTSATDYYWAKDGHHNAKGYELMAQCIYDSLFKKP
jgi:lysophospholipase L1-like esterase